jgi:hypothetical protein
MQTRLTGACEHTSAKRSNPFTAIVLRPPRQSAHHYAKSRGAQRIAGLDAGVTTDWGEFQK